jgi:hypothetical protein
MIGEMIVIGKSADRRQLWMKFCHVGGLMTRKSDEVGERDVGRGGETSPWKSLARLKLAHLHLHLVRINQ